MYGPEEHVVYTGSGTGRRLGRPLGVWEHGPHGGGTVQAHLKDPAGLAPDHRRTVRAAMKRPASFCWRRVLPSVCEKCHKCEG